MNQLRFNNFCKKLKSSTHIVQWGGCDVWKVGGKVYAIGTTYNDKPAYTFKVSPISFEVLKNQPGFRPAPYLASRGLKWIQHFADPKIDSKQLKHYIKQSYEIIYKALPKVKQRDLGLI